LFVYVYIFKNRYVTDDATYINVIRETLPTDFIHIWLALAIVIYQMITIIQYYFAWKRDSVKVE